MYLIRKFAIFYILLIAVNDAFAGVPSAQVVITGDSKPLVVEQIKNHTQNVPVAAQKYTPVETAPQSAPMQDQQIVNSAPIEDNTLNLPKINKALQMENDEIDANNNTKIKSKMLAMLDDGNDSDNANVYRSDGYRNIRDGDIMQRNKQRLEIPDGTVRVGAISKNSSLFQQSMEDGYRALNAGSIEAALNYYLIAYGINSNDVDNLFAIGLCYHKLNQLKDAMGYYLQVLKIDSNYIKAISNLWSIIISISGSSPKDAIDRLEEIHEKNPDVSFVLAQIGAIYASLAQYEKALEKLMEAHKIDPNNIYIIYNIGILFDTMGIYDEAYKYYSRALDSVENSGEKFDLDAETIFERMRYIKNKQNKEYDQD